MAFPARNFPPRPGSGREQGHQQRLPLRLPNNPQGLNRAIDQAFEIRGLLNQEKFDWANYLDQERSEALSWGKVIESLHQQYLGQGGKEETWRHEYLAPFRKRGHWQKPSDLEEMRTVLLAIAPETRVIKRTALALAKLADAAGLDHDLRRLVGTYNSNEAVNPRDIPCDEEIAYWWGQIPNSEGRCAYALQAVYGLRNYEIFLLDFADFPVVFVNRGKTKAERSRGNFS